MRVAVRWLTALTVLCGLVATALPAQAAETAVTVVDGGAPGWARFDTSGNAIDAHDGEIKEFSYVGKTARTPRYYLYGTAYGCGYLRMHGFAGDSRPVTPFCGFTVYESTDMRHWKYDGKLFNPATTSPTNWQQICNSATPSCYRPHVLYDYAAGRYVLWVNTYDADVNGVQHGYHVLTSSSPTGPFTEATNPDGSAAVPNLLYATGGDFDLFQDSNSAHTGYIVYTVRADPLGGSFGYKTVIERLAPGYLTGSGAATQLGTRHTEAPSMFRRGSDYYITIADPFCAYCNGAPSTYVRSRQPLGPYVGAGSGSVGASQGGMALEGRGGLFTGRDQSPEAQQALAGLTDYDIGFRTVPYPDTVASHKTHWARSGWMFRASDLNNGYYWILSNQPYGAAPARLLKETIVNGQIAKITAVPVTVPFTAGRWSNVVTRAVGSTIQTFLNGKLVDTTTDTTYTSGYTALRERPGDEALFDNVVERSPATPGATVTTYLGETFDDTSLAAFPTLNTYRRHGVKFSSDSCSGQPDDVAALAAPASSANPQGGEFLFQSDRWDNGDQNEAQAVQYWEPLRFDSTGAIRPLRCASLYTTVLTNAKASTSPFGGFDKALDGFVLAQDISASHSRGQRFAVAKDTTLSSVRLPLYRTDDADGNSPNADLTVSLYDVEATGGLPSGSPIVQATVSAGAVAWSARQVTVPLSAALNHTHHYAFVLSTTSTTGAYGVARSDGTVGDVDPNGAGLQASGDPSAPQWLVEPTHDLKYSVVTTG